MTQYKINKYFLQDIPEIKVKTLQDLDLEVIYLYK